MLKSVGKHGLASSLTMRRLSASFCRSSRMAGMPVFSFALLDDLGVCSVAKDCVEKEMGVDRLLGWVALGEVRVLRGAGRADVPMEFTAGGDAWVEAGSVEGAGEGGGELEKRC